MPRIKLFLVKITFGILGFPGIFLGNIPGQEEFSQLIFFSGFLFGDRDHPLTFLQCKTQPVILICD
jgi:hypothetical protein